MSNFNYYEQLDNSLFDEMKQLAVSIWNTYDNTHWYATEKIDRIKDLENIRDNIWHIYGMFDWLNQAKLKSLASEVLLSKIEELEIYNRSFM
jgi:hypothetical protein